MLGSYNRKKQSKIVAAEGERKENPTKMEQGKQKKEDEKKTKNLPNSPEITNLGGIKTLVHTKFSVGMFLKALFLAVKKWKQPKFPSNAKEIDNCAKAKGPVFWSSDMNSALIGKFPGAKKDKRAEGEVGIRG